MPPHFKEPAACRVRTRACLSQVMPETGRGKEGTLLQEAGELMWQALESRLLPVVILSPDRKREESEKASGAGRRAQTGRTCSKLMEGHRSKGKNKGARRQPE